MKIFIFIFIFLLSSGFAFGNPEHQVDMPLEIKNVTEHIYKKCLLNAKRIREEEVCKAKKQAIQQCVEQEAKAKDTKSAKTKCELLHLPPSK